MDKRLSFVKSHKWLAVFVILFACGIITIFASAPKKTPESSQSTNQQSSQTNTTNTPVNTEPIVRIEDYLNKPMDTLASQLGVTRNQVGNIVYDNPGYKMLIESKNGQTSTFVQVEIKDMTNCKADNTVLNVADEALSKVGLKPEVKGSADNKAGINIGSAQFCDYNNKIYDLGVSCDYDGGYYTVSLSSDRAYCEL